MRFIFGKHMFFLLILAKSLENAHDLPMTLEFQRSQLYHNKRLRGTTTAALAYAQDGLSIPALIEAGLLSALLPWFQG